MKKTVRHIITHILILLVALSVQMESSWANANSFNNILRQNVKYGRVNYQGINQGQLNQFLSYVENANVNAMGRQAQLAFYVNAYNAICIRLVLDNYASVKNNAMGVLAVKGFFDQKKYKVAGATVSLNQLEKQIIKSRFNEARTHFVLVCAAKGCPILISSAYTSSNIVRQMDIATKRYLSSPTGLKVDRNNKTIYLSRIFQWYRGDFGSSDASKESYSSGELQGVRKFISRYRGDIKSELMSYDIKFLHYTWTLNKQ
ncbi:MAG: DUF547 domain-containing protein [Spirochaetota bacterium]|nr:DUF547 domain-containing protein [Spirochaetota bacterium]